VRLTELLFNFIAVHFAVTDVIEDGKLQKALADLINPVIEEFCVHKLYHMHESHYLSMTSSAVL